MIFFSETFLKFSATYACLTPLHRQDEQFWRSQLY